MDDTSGPKLEGLNALFQIFVYLGKTIFIEIYSELFGKLIQLDKFTYRS